MNTKPHRVQLTRSTGWRMPANTVKVDRTTLFGNPFSIKGYGRDQAVALHHAWITGAAIYVAAAKLAEKREAVLRALPSIVARGLPLAGVLCQKLANRIIAMRPCCWNWPTVEAHRGRAALALRRCPEQLSATHF